MVYLDPQDTARFWQASGTRGICPVTKEFKTERMVLYKHLPEFIHMFGDETEFHHPFYKSHYRCVATTSYEDYMWLRGCSEHEYQTDPRVAPMMELLAKYTMQVIDYASLRNRVPYMSRHEYNEVKSLCLTLPGLNEKAYNANLEYRHPNILSDIYCILGLRLHMYQIIKKHRRQIDRNNRYIYSSLINNNPNTAKIILRELRPSRNALSEACVEVFCLW